MNVNAIFDAIDKASTYVNLKEAIRRKKEQVDSCEANRCGNCYHWMKTTCAPEKLHKQFKSCASLACNNFEHDSGSKKLANEFSSELVALQTKLSDFVKGV